MEIGGVAIGASTITSVFTATLRISQAVYELKAVGEQTRDLLDTTKHIDDSMRNVRVVRRQKSALLTATEKEWVDCQIKNTEKAVRGVAALIEPARVDMQTKSNSTKDIRFKNRVMFVLRDSPNVAVQLTKLSIATQGLNAAMGVLCTREGGGGLEKLKRRTVKHIDRRSSSPSQKAPPSYELSEFMNRRRTTGAIPRIRDLNHKVSRVSFVNEDLSGDESITLSARRSQATLRTKSSWATTEELVHSPEDARTETRNEESASAAPTPALISRDTPYLNQFDRSPACIPVLTYGEATPPIRAETHSSAGGHETYAIDAWKLETLQALEEQQNMPTPTLRARRSSDHLSPHSIPSASVSQVSLDSSMARMELAGPFFPDQQWNPRPQEMLPSHPPLVTHESDPNTSRMPGAYPPPIPPRPASFQPQHSHTHSMSSLQDGRLKEAPEPFPLHFAPPRSPPFHFLTPQIHASKNENVETWGKSRPPKPTKPTRFASTATSPPPTHQTSPPYPSYSAPSTAQFPPLTHVLSDPLPQSPSPPRIQRKPIALQDLNSPPSPPIGTSLAGTATQYRNLIYYKPLPDLPFSRNPSMTSVRTVGTAAPSITSTQSEPPGVIAETRMTRGRMWLEHHAERSAAVTMRDSVGGPLSGGFLAPLPQPRVREV
jgi:hypothetical protein